MNNDTIYLNTDLDLKSISPIDNLISELDRTCCVLHYVSCEEGDWHATVESQLVDDDRRAEDDIRALTNAMQSLSTIAKAELKSCYLRELNVGFEHGETWAYVHKFSHEVLELCVELGCSLALTLYPRRENQETP